MKEVYIKAEELNEDILNELANKDIFSLNEIIQAFEETVYKYKILEEEFEDYKEDVEETMQPRTHWTAKEISMYNSNN